MAHEEFPKNGCAQSFVDRFSLSAQQSGREREKQMQIRGLSPNPPFPIMRNIMNHIFVCISVFEFKPLASQIDAKEK